jgi:undecaprenyl-diphosphatase
MTFIQSLILGLVQGLTEFLPVSSSAHLVLVPFVLNWTLDPTKAFIFDVLVQLGTLVAVIAYFWKDLLAILKAVIAGIRDKKPFEEVYSRLGWFIILATIPAGLGGLLLKSKVEAAFANPIMTAVLLFVTAIMLTLAEIFSPKERNLESVSALDALVIGFFQLLAIFPGISRSGATISGGLSRGLKREAAARFAFLMSIPVMLAAGLLSVLDLLKIPDLGSFLPVLSVGFIAALVVGYLSIRWLLNFLKSRSLIPFAVYCAVVSILTIFIAYFR